MASAAKPGKSLNYARHRETIARELYREFNRDGFGGALPETLEISWNAKLLTTAGLTHYRKVTRSSGKSEYHARIELSTKVLDAAEKLEATLLHEMCHAAAWLLDKCAKPPHGSVFKKWATRVMRVYPVVSVDTCHSYAIHQPYKYRCTQSWCQQEYGRHSKSIDVEAKACGVCNGKLDHAGGFVPGNGGQGMRIGTVDEMEIGMAEAARGGAYKHLVRAGLGHRQIADFERAARFFQDGCFHVSRSCIERFSAAPAYGTGAARVGCVTRQAFAVAAALPPPLPAAMPVPIFLSSEGSGACAANSIRAMERACTSSGPSARRRVRWWA